MVKDLFEWTEAGACGGAGDPKLSAADESTIAPGIFLAGPQVVHDDAVFCFVYKYRQRFAVVVDQIAARLGLDTTKAVSKAKKHNMFLDDLSCCRATCGTGTC